LLILPFLLISTVVDTYKILVYNSKFGHSHANFMGSIADVLAEAGHNVTTLMSILDPSVRDGTTRSTMIYVNQSAEVAALQGAFKQKFTDFFSSSNYDPRGSYKSGKFFGSLFTAQCKAVLDDVQLIERLKNEHFDVMIAQHFDMCGVGLVELIKPKSYIATASSFPFGQQHEEFGLPVARSYDPAMFTTHLDVHSTWSRALNIYADYLWRFNFYIPRIEIDALFQARFGPKFPSVMEIGAGSAYVFVNSEPLIDYAVPTITKVIHIPGIGAKEPKELDAEWEAILTRRPRSILLSFGSMVKSIYLPHQIKMSFIEAIKAFPDITFIWKYEDDDDFTKNIGSKVGNLLLTKWMPQVDILNHPNLRAFITHGGMGSTQETALRGVPGIFVPLFGDQPRNAGMMEFNQLGKVMDKFELMNSTKFIEVITEVLENKSYYKNAKRISAMLRKKPFSSREQLIKYTEFAAEFGASPALRPQSHDMNFVEYNNLDIIVAMAFLLGSLIFVSFCFVRTIVTKMSKQ
ncbi:hypothetical protein PFISCL1PPCAC_3392, partial [Pristionchus fissidentatus]